MRILLLLIVLLAARTALAEGGEYRFTTPDGRARDYLLSVPAKPGDAPLPLIVVLHGTYGTADKMERYLGFDKYVEAYRVVVAYPDAYRERGARRTLRWNDGRGTLASSAAGIDDVAALRALVDDIGRRVNLDRRRIFVAGASNGGMMAYRVGCEAADLVAGIAPVIGAVARPIFPGCHPARPISVLAINGMDDPIVPFAGGTVCADVPKIFCERGEVSGAEDSLRRFADGAGCKGAPTVADLPPSVDDGTSVRRVDYRGCPAGVRVRGLWIKGGGHAWPPLPSQIGQRRAGRSTGNLDATEAIVRFFLLPGDSIP